MYLHWFPKIKFWSALHFGTHSAKYLSTWSPKNSMAGHQGLHMVAWSGLEVPTALKVTTSAYSVSMQLLQIQ